MAPLFPPDERARGQLPLRPGRHGAAVLDLQGRLAELDFPAGDPLGHYGEETAQAVGAFQRQRGLPATGCCDEQTWRCLVEAGYQLGERVLYRQAPMLRGDDVAELQRRLSALGFDPGRVDGIFGDQTALAVADFQRNAGLPVDGQCGWQTLADLVRFQLPEGGGELVSPISERLRMGASGMRTLAGRRIAVGEHGGFMAGAAALARALREQGATALELHDPDPSRQAAEANAAEVDCFVSLEIDPERSTCTTAYYRGFHYESVTSRALAELLQRRLPSVLGLADGGLAPMALPILRETRMPAVEVQLGDPAAIVQRIAALATTIVECLRTWVGSSFD